MRRRTNLPKATGRWATMDDATQGKKVPSSNQETDQLLDENSNRQDRTVSSNRNATQKSSGLKTSSSSISIASGGADETNPMEITETVPPTSLSTAADTACGENYLLALLVLFFCSYCISAVLSKRVAILAVNYPYVLTQLSPFMGTVVYFLLVVYQRLLTNFMNDVETRRVPYWKACVVGALFSLHNMLVNLGNRGTTVPGYVTLLIAKMVVPASAFLSMAPPLSHRCDRYEWSGIGMLMVGISIVLIHPTNHEDDRGDPKDDSNLESEDTGTPIAFLILLEVIAIFPLAIAMLFVQVQITRYHPKLSVSYLWMTICTAEFWIGLLLAPISARLQFPTLFQHPNHVDDDQELNGSITQVILKNFADGMKCILLGITTNSSEHSDGTLDDITATAETHETCHNVPKFYFLSLAFGCVYNLAMAESVRQGGATLMWFVRAMTLPFASVLFTFPILMGKDFASKSISSKEIVGMIVVTIALIVYNTKAFVAYIQKIRGNTNNHSSVAYRPLTNNDEGLGAGVDE